MVVCARRLTSMHRHDLYDLLMNEYPKQQKHSPSHPKGNNEQGHQCRDTYSLHLDVCEIPDLDEYVEEVRVGVASRWMTVLGESTRRACQHVCSIVYPLYCSSVIYDRHNRSCLLSSYTGMTSSVTCQPGVEPREFYLKHRCLGNAVN